MTEAERLAERLEEKAHNHTQDDIAEWSYMTEAATLIRSQSARIAALEDALRVLLDASERHIFGDECLAERVAARLALGKGSE